jgi:hypothetical protein
MEIYTYIHAGGKVYNQENDEVGMDVQRNIRLCTSSMGGCVSNADRDGNHTLEITCIGGAISTFATLA